MNIFSFFKKRFPNSAMIVSAIIFVTVSGFFWDLSQREARFSKTEHYHFFVDDLKQNNVKKIRYFSPDELTGQRKIEVQRLDGQRYKTYRPGLEQDLIENLANRSVEIDVQEYGMFSFFISIFAITFKTFLIFSLLIFLFNWLVRGEFSLTLVSDLTGSETSTRWKNLKGKQENSDDQLSGKITLDDVAGCLEAKRETKELIDYLKDPIPFEKLGARMPRGVLFAGPPGTGKTLLAKAIAAEANVPFLACAGSEFDEKYVGVGASRIRQLFIEAKKLAPCVIFVDEIDSIGQKRGSGQSHRPSDSQTLNQFLIEMDGFEPNDRIIIFAATNRAAELDPALVRPGRFDRHIILHYPTQQERLEILNVHAKKIKLSHDVDLNLVAKMTVGFAGADLANLLNESALCAVRHEREAVTFTDLQLAYDRVLMGLERSALTLSQDDLKRTAYHEAGHALVSLALKDSDPIHKLTILPRGQSLGATYSVPDSEKIHLQETHCYQQLAVCCGGRAAEALIYGQHYVSTGSSAGEGSDMSRASRLVRAMIEQYGFAHSPIGLLSFSSSESQMIFSSKTLEAIERVMVTTLNDAYAVALKVLSSNRGILERVKDELLLKETIDRSDLFEILKETPLVLDDIEAMHRAFSFKTLHDFEKMYHSSQLDIGLDTVENSTEN